MRKPAVKPAPTAKAWTDRFLEHLTKERGVSPYTVRNYAQTLGEFQHAGFI